MSGHLSRAQVATYARTSDRYPEVDLAEACLHYMDRAAALIAAGDALELRLDALMRWGNAGNEDEIRGEIAEWRALRGEDIDPRPEEDER